MTSDKDQLIDLGDHWKCPECMFTWSKNHEPSHGRDCPLGPFSEDMLQKANEFINDLDGMGEEIGAYDRLSVPVGQQIPGKVVPLYGWVCSKCQRVFAPYVSECPHCQPPGCGFPR